MRYLDAAASTRVDDEIIDAMLPFFSESYGNASSIHSFGRKAQDAITRSRRLIAESINAKVSEVIFTSGGTESNNLAVKGTAFAKGEGHIVTSKIEHDCILNASKWLEQQGFRVTYLDVDSQGFVDPDDVEKAIAKDTFLVSIMHANNEIGTIEPVAQIGKVCKEHDVLFHTDACQSYTKIPIDVEEMNLDLMTINSHKIHGPKGVGALFVREGTKIEPLLHGGGHEFGLRSGTENVPGIIGFVKAVQVAKRLDVEKMTRLRDKLIDGLLEIPDTRLNGPRKRRLCNNVNVSFDFIEGEAITLRLDSEGVEVSTGSACSSDSLEPSHVLLATGLPEEVAHGSIRLSLDKYTTEEDIEHVIETTQQVVSDLRKFSPFKRQHDLRAFDGGA